MVIDAHKAIRGNIKDWQDNTPERRTLFYRACAMFAQAGAEQLEHMTYPLEWHVSGIAIFTRLGFKFAGKTMPCVHRMRDQTRANSP